MIIQRYTLHPMKKSRIQVEMRKKVGSGSIEVESLAFTLNLCPGDRVTKSLSATIAGDL
ncbi:MAG: hypothetical protein P8X74_17505 [Reinekea sp.]